MQFPILPHCVLSLAITIWVQFKKKVFGIIVSQLFASIVISVLTINLRKTLNLCIEEPSTTQPIHINKHYNYKADIVNNNSKFPPKKNWYFSVKHTQQTYQYPKISTTFNSRLLSFCKLGIEKMRINMKPNEQKGKYIALGEKRTSSKLGER